MILLDTNYLIRSLVAETPEALRIIDWIQTGRKRNLRVDAMIASAAIITDAKLATENITDFTNFVHLGLQLV